MFFPLEPENRQDSVRVCKDRRASFEAEAGRLAFPLRRSSQIGNDTTAVRRRDKLCREHDRVCKQIISRSFFYSNDLIFT